MTRMMDHAMRGRPLGWGAAIAIAAAVMAFMLLLAVLSRREPQADRISNEQRELIQLCRDRGGVPILAYSINATYLNRCDFPPGPAR